MNNKPYGWVKNGEYVLYIDKPDNVFSYTPLYTHPAKTLTDEEIFDVANGFPFIENGIERCEFARAILRKAQEK